MTIVRSSTPAWPEEDRRRLVDAFGRGGTKAVLAEFPNRRGAQLLSAIRRFTNEGDWGRPKHPVDVGAIRAAIAALPDDQFFERLHSLRIESPASRRRRSSA